MGHLLSQLFEITNQFEMKTQPQLLLLQKTMVVTEGVAREFNPKLNIWSLSEPILNNLENIKLKAFSKIPFNKRKDSPSPKEIYLSIINEIEKTKKDFKKIKSAFGEEGLKIDENSIMQIKKDNNAGILSSRYVLIILAVIAIILLINL
jgi:ubiquinone biosynthesis protein